MCFIELGHITFVEIDPEIVSTVFISRPLIQEGQLSVTIESMHTKVLVNGVRGLNLLRKSVRGLLTGSTRLQHSRRGHK